MIRTVLAIFHRHQMSDQESNQFPKYADNIYCFMGIYSQNMAKNKVSI